MKSISCGWKLYLSLLFVLIAFSNTGRTQSITYPSVAQGIVRGLGDSTLIVNIAFTAVCGGGTASVKIALPVSVSYVPGSLASTGGSLSIAEASIADLRQPEFLVSGITAIGDNITFTIRRKAGCSGASSGKDSIFITAATPCSNTSDISSTNSYNIFSPSISVNAPASVSGVNVGDTLTLTSTVINGGNGCTDTVYFYTVYKAASLNVYETKIGTTAISSYAASGDTLFYKIAGSTLTADGLLCSGESITLTQKAIVKRCSDLNTYYGAGFGNGTGTMCGWATGSTVINLDNTPPFINVLSPTVGSAPTCAGDPWVMTSYLKNTGHSPLTNIYFSLGDEDGGGAMTGNIYLDTASLMIKTPVLASGALHHPAGIVQIRSVPGATAACAAAGENAAAMAYTFPAGTPPLMPGDSIAITYQFKYCAASLVCGVDAKTFINWSKTIIGFTDQCGTSVPRYVADIRYLYNPTGAGVNEIRVPAMVIPGDCYSATVVGGFNLGSAALSANNIEEVKVGLPAGTTYTSGSLSNLYGDVPLAGYPVQVGDTLIIRYNASATPLERMFELKMNLCSSATGPCGSGVKLGASSLIVVDSTCADKIGQKSCLSKDENYVCLGSGCPSGGAQMIGFNYARSSFGLPDNDNNGQPDASGTLDMTKIELDRYKPADIMKTKYVAKVISGSTVTSWNYMYSEWNFGKGPWRAYDSATIKIYKSGTLLYTLTGIPMTDVTGTGNQFFADWSTALATVAPGFSYSTTTVDSVVVEGSFKFVPSFHTISATEVSVHSDDVPYHTTQDAQLSQSVFTTETGPGGTRSTCGVTALYNYRAYAMSAYSWAAFYPNAPFACNYGSMMYRTHDVLGNLSLPGRAFNYEYRANSYIDTVEFDIPAGWEYNGIVSAVTWIPSPATGSTNTGYASSLAPYTTVTGNTATGRHVLINVKGAVDAGALSPLPSDAYYTDFSALVRPTCDASYTTAAWSIKSHYLSYNAPDSQLHFITSGAANYGAYDSSVTYKANLSLQNNSGIISAVQPQHYWDIKVSNLNTNYAASNVWFALEDGSSPINIDSVVLKPSNVVLTPISYGSGNKIYQALTTLAASGSQDVRIYFKTTSCAPANINFLAGWRCEGFPTVPELSCLGTTRTMTLQVNPQPSQVQLSVARQPGNGSPIDLCTVDSTLLIVNSAQSANLADPYLIIYPETGLTLSPPIQVEYPLGSGDYQNATVTSVAGGGFKIDLTSHTAIGTNGILGTTLANPGYSPLGGDRQAKVKLNYTTDCSFTSGQPMRFYTYGSRPCGAPALGNGDIATTSAVNINGVLVSGSAGVTLSSSASTMSCGDIATFSLTAVPVSTATQAGDTVVYTLPAGVVYHNNFVRGTNCAACEITAEAGPAGTTIVKVKMETGVAASSTLAYSFDIQSAGSGCTPAAVNAVYKRTLATPLTCGGTPCPSSSAIIGSGASSVITLNKPNLVISNVTVLDTPSWRQANYFANHVKVFYNNNGSLAYTGGVDTVEFFCNSSSTIPFAKQPLTKSLAVGASDSDEYYIMMPIGSCSTGDVVTVRIQTPTAGGTSQCVCSPSMFQTAGIPLPLRFVRTGISATDCAVNITWSYSVSGSETIRGFEIERSANGSEYSTVNIAGASADNYIDVTPTSGKWFYRIKAITLDGKQLYSNTLIAMTQKCMGNSVSVYPNPVSEMLNVVLQGGNENGSYEIIDALGRTLQKGILVPNNNNQVDISKLAQGAYLFKVLRAGYMTMQQINIAR